MPRKDADSRRAWSREWMRRRRTEFLARRPCRCGAPSTTIVAEPGMGKLSWSWSDGRLNAALDARRVRCDECAAREKAEERERTAEERSERQRRSNRESMQRRRAAERAGAAPEPVRAPLEPRPAVIRRPAAPDAPPGPQRKKPATKPAPAVLTVFDDPGWRRERALARQRRRAELGMTSAPLDEDE